MARAVKSPYRAEQAEQTRDRIARAARRVFAERGYGSTSVEVIAVEAGLATRTVYAAFGTKREILSRICEIWLEEAGARDRAAAVLAEPDLDQRVRGAADWLTHLYESGLDVATMFEGASDEDQETRALLRAKLAGRDHVLDSLVAAIEPALARPVAEVQAVFRALAAPGVYRALVHESGWTTSAFTDWLVAALRRA